MKVPDVVGVPLICPLDALRLNPVGRVPELRDHVYGVVPPVACTVTGPYAEFWVPLATEVVVIDNGGTAGEITMLSPCDAVCGGELESFTCTVKLNVPAAVGVPPICPSDEVRLSPEGKDPELTDHE